MKSYLTLSIILLLHVASTSQIIGVKAGPVFSKLNYSNSYSNNISFDKIHFGHFTRFDLSYLNKKHVELNSSIGFLWAGGRGERWVQEVGTFDAKSSMVFLNITSQVRFKIPVFKSAMFYVGFGPRIDVPLWYKENVYFFRSIDDITDDSFTYYETSGGISKLLYGVVAETGYRIQRGKNNFSLSVSYNHNSNKLVNLYSAKASSELKPRDWAWLNYLTVGFGWGFNCSKN
ncbi:MAG: hypothetical protein IPO32_08910 [Crocinitomicaceae bacterium]|nr:hypothetical protein [Crocinitomicaceae bacterium]